MIAETIDLTKLRELQLFKQGKAVAPSQVFREIYGPLADLIRYNQSTFSASLRLDSSHSDSDDPVRQRFATKAAEAIERTKGSSGFAAVARFDSGAPVSYQVQPRTNYESDAIVKVPNIIHLVPTNGEGSLVLREARVYDEKVMAVMGKRARFSHKEHYRGPIGVGTVHSHDSDVTMVPEPHALLALEQAKLEGVVGRITPKMRVVGADEGKVWYVRNFLTPVRDASIVPRQIIEYFGRLNGLGLTDHLDTNPAHYCLGRNGVVNIDPDFLLHTKSDSTLDNVWSHNTSRDPSWRGVVPNGYFAGDEGKKMRKQVMNQTRVQLGLRTLLDYVPQNIKTAPALSALMVENPHLG
jgi:hypothetical protein